MKTFQEFITEGRDAPLYHSTGMKTAVIILRDNMLKARQFHPGERDHYDRVSQSLKRNNTHQHLHKTNGTSLTRSLQFALNWKYLGVVFEIDQHKLAQTHKIVPYNYFMHKTRESPTKDDFMTQMEEVVIGNVNNFDRYLAKIIVETKGQYDMICEEKIYHIIANHPKLYLLYDKRFANLERVPMSIMPILKKSVPFA